MLVAGLVGFGGDWFGAAAVILFLGFGSIVAALFILRLPKVSEQTN